MADSLAGIASVYALQGEFDDAVALYRQALQVREESLGPNHPDTVRTLEALSEVYFKLNQPVEAEKLEARALEIRTMKR